MDVHSQYGRLHRSVHLPSISKSVRYLGSRTILRFGHKLFSDLRVSASGQLPHDQTLPSIYHYIVSYYVKKYDVQTRLQNL